VNASPMNCRAEAIAPEEGKGTCGMPAAVGLVTEGEHVGNVNKPYTVLELLPLCEDHAPEWIHEATISMADDEWSVVTLAYGASGGDLR
jgi:hypothetical protein